MSAATPAVGSKVAKPVESAQVERLRRVMQGYEGRLATLATQVNDDESAIAVNGLQGQLFEMQTLLTGLSQEVRCVVANGGGHHIHYADHIARVSTEHLQCKNGCCAIASLHGGTFLQGRKHHIRKRC